MQITLQLKAAIIPREMAAHKVPAADRGRTFARNRPAKPQAEFTISIDYLIPVTV